ncbi:MAG: FIST N-terminal domain-containing protein [Candidatus Omnitrophota bacterium]
MIDIGTGISVERNEVAAVEEAVRLAKTKKLDREKIDLALVFNSPDISASGVLKNISVFLPNVPVIGGTVSGFFSHLGICKRGVIVMLVTFPEGIYLTTGNMAGIAALGEVIAGEQMGEKLLYGFKSVPRSLSLLFFDELTQGNINFIYGLQEKLGKSFPAVGAALSSPGGNNNNSLYFNDTPLVDGCAGILFGGKISYGLGLRHGWKPLGKPHAITETAGNVIHKIDGQPAVQLYEEYLAYDFQRIKKEIKNLSELYPIGIRIPGQNEYLLRSILSIEEDGSLVCHGNIPAGSTTRLMISTKETCLEATREAANEAKANLNTRSLKFHKEKTSKLVIVFSSFSRALSLGKDIQTEWKIIADAFEPGTDIIGISTFGELAPLATTSYHGQTYFQNQILSILILEG